MRTYGYTPDDVTALPSGAVAPGVQLTVWDAPTAGAQVLDLLDADGSPLPGYVLSGADGAYGWKHDGSFDYLYASADAGVTRWAVQAHEALTDKLDTATANSTIAAAVAPKLDAAVAASTYTRSGVQATQRFMALLGGETRDASILVIGDSTGNEAGEWPDLFTRALASQWAAWTVKYQLWNDTTGAYDAASTIQTGTGSRTLTLYNASVSGFSTSSWRGGRADAAIYALSPDVVMVSLGHNEQALTDDLWYSRHLTLTESVAAAKPSADILIIAQNPETANTYQQQRRVVYRDLATRRGYGFIDVCQAFLDTGNVPAYLIADGIHPNPAGSQLWADTVSAAFVRDKKLNPTPQPQTPLLARGTNLLLNGDFSALTAGVPDNWGLTACTNAIDSTNYESGVVQRTAGGSYTASQAQKFTGTGTGAALSQYIPFKQVRGGWVTAAVRAYIAAGQSANVCRVGITDTTGSTINIADTQPTGSGFRWFIVSRFVPATATNCRVLIYVDSSAGLGSVTIDRVVMVPGKLPNGS